MKRYKASICWIIAVFILSLSSLVFAQEDRKGCKDHPLFSRMQGYRIAVCRDREFDAEDFIDPATQQLSLIHISEPTRPY